MAIRIRISSTRRSPGSQVMTPPTDLVILAGEHATTGRHQPPDGAEIFVCRPGCLPVEPETKIVAGLDGLTLNRDAFQDNRPSEHCPNGDGRAGGRGYRLKRRGRGRLRSVEGQRGRYRRELGLATCQED
jgi:hypothetical protein